MLRPPQFLLDLDARAWRAVGATLALLVSIALIFVFGRTAFGLQAEHDVEGWLKAVSGSPWGLPAAILIFTVTAFVGAPQFILIAACVVAFGPWLGFLYGWIATVVSAAVTFYVGRVVGLRAMERFGGRGLHRISDFVGRNAFAGSFIIRNVPSAPFAFVNMAFGVSRASFWSFISGCALGVLPKTALVALFGRSFMSIMGGKDWRGGLLIAAAGGVWLALMLLARRVLEARIRGRTSKEAG